MKKTEEEKTEAGWYEWAKSFVVEDDETRNKRKKQELKNIKLVKAVQEKNLAEVTNCLNDGADPNTEYETISFYKTWTKITNSECQDTVPTILAVGYFCCSNNLELKNIKLRKDIKIKEIVSGNLTIKPNEDSLEESLLMSVGIFVFSNLIIKLFKNRNLIKGAISGKNTVLHLAASQSHINPKKEERMESDEDTEKIVKLLLEKGANIKHKGID